MSDIDDLLRQLENPTYGQASEAAHAQQLLEALESSGDIRPGEQQALDALRQAEPAISQEIGATGATYRGALQGATLQQADEIYGLFGGDKAGARAKNAAAEQNFPSEYQTGKTAGAIGTMGATAAVPGMTGANAWGTLGRGMLAGGVGGGLWGSGGAEGWQNKAVEGLKEAGIGAAVGGAAVPAVWAGAKGLGILKDLGTGAIEGLTGKGNARKASRAVMETVNKAGKTPQEVAQMVEDAHRLGLHDYRTADALGGAGARRASGVVRSGGSEELEEFLRQRQFDQRARVSGDIDEAFGMNGRSAKSAKAEVEANRKKVTKRLYSDAKQDAKPVDVRGAVAILDDTIAQMENSGITPPRAVKEAKKLRRQLAGETPNGDPTTLSDYESVRTIWRETRSKVDSSFKKGKGDIGEVLAPVRDALRDALEESSDLFRTANDLHHRGKNVEEAIKTGQTMARTSDDLATDNISLFDALSGQEQRAARIGYGNTLKREVQGRGSMNAMQPFNSTKRTDEVAHIAENPGGLLSKLGFERDMARVDAAALSGSRTADNQAAMENLGPLANAGRAARDAAAGNVGNAMTNAASAIAPYIRGETEATRALIARALMSQDPMAVLKPALKSKKNADRVKRIVEGALRGAFMSGQ